MAKTHAIKILKKTESDLLNSLDLLNRMSVKDDDFIESKKEIEKKLNNLKSSINILDSSFGIVFSNDSTIMILSNGTIELITDKKVNSKEEDTNLSNVIDNTWTQLKELLEDKKGVTYNFTFNVDATSSKEDTANFAEVIMDNLKNKRGIL